MTNEGPSGEIVFPKHRTGDATHELARRDIRKLVEFFDLLDRWSRQDAGEEITQD